VEGITVVSEKEYSIHSELQDSSNRGEQEFWNARIPAEVMEEIDNDRHFILIRQRPNAVTLEA
jgi:hypothetical protein